MKFEEACINYPFIILLLNPKTGMILDANKKAIEVYGYSIDELKGMSIMDINMLKKEQIVEEMEIARRERRNYFHFPHKTKDGIVIEMEVESYPTKLEGEDVLFSLIKSCENSSYSNSAAIKLVQESKDIVMVLDQDCRIVKINKEFSKVLKCDETKAIGNLIYDYIKVINNVNYDSLNENLVSGEVIEMEIEIDNFKDKYKYSSLIGIPTYFRDKFFGAVVSIRDRTSDAIKEIEKAKKLETALKNAEKYRKEKDEFYARMSHDMRTPLNAVISYSDFGMHESENGETAKYFKQIKESSKYLLGLIDDILSFNKLENGTIFLNEKPVIYNEIVKNVYTIIKARSDLKGVELEMNLDDNTWQCQMFDELRIKQIYLNVLNNAVKYSNPKGKVIWNQKYMHDENGKPYFRNVIIDNGIGMTDGFIKIMFEPYTREQNELSFFEESSGLGLYIVKSLLDVMGGKIDCISEVGIGTTMILDIPAKELTMEDCIEKTKDKEKCSYKGNRVLIVEDNLINYNIGEKILNDIDIETENAVDGLVGVKMAKEKKYDAILMDIRMPNMGGLEATAEIRKFDSEIPIIGFSANASDEDLEEAVKNGMDAYLKKPVDRDELYEILSKLLNKGRKKAL